MEEKDADNISTLQIIHTFSDFENENCVLISAKSPVLIRSSCVVVEVKF